MIYWRRPHENAFVDIGSLRFRHRMCGGGVAEVHLSVAAGANLVQLAFGRDADGRVRVEIGPDGTLFIMR